MKLHKNGQLLRTIKEIKNYDLNINEINLDNNINQIGLNSNQVDNKNMIQIKIKKDAQNDHLYSKDIKRPKSKNSGMEKMEAE